MAETNIIYVLEYETYNTAIRNNLCFSCAVKTALNKVDEASIYAESTDYAYHTCNSCGQYIKDKITL